MATTSTLAPRGAELAKGLSMREQFGSILTDKYDPKTNPDGFINLGTSENYIMLPTIADYISTHPPRFSSDDFSYGEGPWSTQRLRQGLANHFNRRFKPFEKVDQEDVLVSNGVTSVCEWLGFCLFEPGDSLVMGSPIYQAFQPDFGTRAGVKTIAVKFGESGVGQFSPAAAAVYEEALLKAQGEGTKIRALLLCHPHNPLGQCYPRETIVEVMRLCQKHKIHLLVDEIYAMSVYSIPGDEQAVPFESVLAFDSSEYISKEYLHVLYGLSKDFGAGGLRLGCLYTRNKELWRAVSAMSQFQWPGIAGERVAQLVLEDEKWLDSFFETSRQQLAERNKITRALLDEKGVGYHKGANAGFFIWANFGKFLAGTGKEGLEAEAELFQKIFKAKVFMTNGQMMFAEEPGWFRIIFSQEEVVIREGMRRVFEAIEA